MWRVSNILCETHSFRCSLSQLLNICFLVQLKMLKKSNKWLLLLVLYTYVKLEMRKQKYPKKNRAKNSIWRANKYTQRLQPRSLMNNSKCAVLSIYLCQSVEISTCRPRERKRDGWQCATERGGAPKCVLYFSFAWLSGFGVQSK